ncbi:copper chaperone PCu(A)C [Allosphingosinicella deserti]|nr:copper chaperone PCu(A)C [Sphingomonas deserti]
MRKSHSRQAMLGFLAVLAACDTSPRVEAEDAVITLPALAGRPGAAYFRLETNQAGDRLLRVETDAAGRAELHETMTAGGMAGMAPLASAPFDTDGTLAFTPGGRHAMLFDMKPGFAAGSKAKMTFTFEKAPPLTIVADVRGPGQGSADHQGH